METEVRPRQAQWSFDMQSWGDGYKRGYLEGREAGEHWAQQGLRDRLRGRYGTMEQDLKLQLLPDMETPLAVLRAVALLVEERTSHDR